MGKKTQPIGVRELNPAWPEKRLLELNQCWMMSAAWRSAQYLHSG